MGDIGPERQRYDVLPVIGLVGELSDHVPDPDPMPVPSPEPIPNPDPSPSPEPVPAPPQ